MPLSNPEMLPVVLYYVGALAPARVLDIGVGMGAYGFLVRQYLDVAHERIDRPQWRVRLEGIEIFEGYRNPVWDYVYDEIRMGDVRSMLVPENAYDMIICADVLEHLERDEVPALLNRLLKSARVVIATTPNRDCPQGAWGGNEAERHRCQLTAADFPKLVTSVVAGSTTCYVSAEDPATVAWLRDLAPGCPTVRPELMKSIAGRVRRKWRAMSGGVRRSAAG